jgi:hypothetical protein
LTGSRRPRRSRPFNPSAGDLTRYTAVTGRAPSAAGLAFYRLAWILADIAGYTAVLRRPHRAGGDAADALKYLGVNIVRP